MVPQPLSDRACRLLNAALSGTGPGLGLLIVVGTPSGNVFMRAGDEEHWLCGDEARAAMEVFQELLDLGMVAPIAPDGSSSECVVTALGHRTATVRPAQ